MKDRTASKNELMRIRRLLKRQHAEEIRLNPGYQTHEQLWQVAVKLPTDFEPYGQRERVRAGDCSCGCRSYHVLAGGAGRDWGVCADPASPRAGLLTFEHQGCPQFERDLRYEFLETAKGKKALQQFEQTEEELRAWQKALPLSPKPRRKRS